MFFVASKLAWFLLTPSNAAILLVASGLALAGRRLVRRLAAAGGGLLLLAGFGPLGSWLIYPLEERFPAFVDDGRPVAGIVVLGGPIESEITAARGQLALGDSAERIVAMGDLARRYPDARLVFSGGSGALLPGDIPEAEALRAHEAELGLAPGRVLYEDRSRTTWENAVETRTLVRPGADERWLLVTSAAHMPRSVGCFRAAGFPVTAYPVDYRTRGAGDLHRGRTDAAGGLARTDAAWREWVGLLGYRLSGRTDAMFPGPN